MVEHYNRQLNDANHHRLVKVHSVQSQVVSGMNYKVKLDLGRTEKKKVSAVSWLGQCSPGSVRGDAGRRAGHRHQDGHLHPLLTALDQDRDVHVRVNCSPCSGLHQASLSSPSPTTVQPS